MTDKPSYEELERRVKILERELSLRFGIEDELKENQERFRMLYERVPMPYQSLDSDGFIVEVNPAWLKNLGYTRGEVIGRSFSEFLHPDWQARFRENFPRFKSEGEVAGAEFKMVKKDGGTVLVSFNGQIGHDIHGNFKQTHCIFQDISEQKKAEQDLWHMEALLNESQTLGGVGGWELNPETSEAFWTENQYRLLGYEPGDIADKDLHSHFMDKVVHPGDQEGLGKTFQSLFTGERQICTEYRAICKNGDEKAFSGKVVAERDKAGTITRIFGSNLDITERKQSEEALREEKEFTETALNAVQDTFILFDPDTGMAIRWNRAFTRITGYSDDEVAGMSIIYTCIAPEDQGLALGFVASVMEKGTDTIEVDLICKNGDSVPMEFSASVVRDDRGEPKYIIAIGRDISDRKEAEQALIDSHQRFLTVLDSIDATVYVVDMASYEVLFMNEYMKVHFGKDMTGDVCYKAYRNESKPCDHCPSPELLDEKGNPTGVCAWQTENPVTGKWYMNYDRAIEWTDGRMVKLQIATDITDLKQMEDELRQAHKMESIGTLAGGVAHDFNNILGIIIGNAELALDDTPEWSPVCGHIKEIKTASFRAKDVVRQLLSFTRKTKLEQTPLDLTLVVRESLTLIRSSIPSSVVIKETLPKSAPAILADATQIHQVMINLCTNAAHAMWETGGTIEVCVENCQMVKETDETIRGVAPGEYLALSVKDSGSGIEPEIREKIFDPYFTTKEVGKGTGMGLSVVHGIVRSHNAHILVDSDSGKGTCFTVFFPVVNARPLAVQFEDAGPDRVHGRAAHILLVDDENPIVNIMTRNLERLGFSVEAQTCPEKALASFSRNPARFDLVISDFTMPKMNGLVLTEKVKTLRPEIPVIICSGHSGRIDEMTADRAGIAAYVRKPISRAGIAEAIDRVMDRD